MFASSAKGSLARKLRHVLINSPITAFKLLVLSSCNVNQTNAERTKAFCHAIYWEELRAKYTCEHNKITDSTLTTQKAPVKRRASSTALFRCKR
jgi:hypothetical protein